LDGWDFHRGSIVTPVDLAGDTILIGVDEPLHVDVLNLANDITYQQPFDFGINLNDYLSLITRLNRTSRTACFLNCLSSLLRLNCIILGKAFPQLLKSIQYGNRMGRRMATPVRCGLHFQTILGVLVEAAKFFNLTNVELSLLSNPIILQFCGTYRLCLTV